MLLLKNLLFDESKINFLRLSNCNQAIELEVGLTMVNPTYSKYYLPSTSLRVLSANVETSSIRA